MYSFHKGEVFRLLTQGVWKRCNPSELPKKMQLEYRKYKEEYFLYSAEED